MSKTVKEKSAIEGWEFCSLENIIKTIQYGLSEKSDTVGKYPILGMNNLYEGKVDIRKLKYININEKIFENFKVLKYDILFNRTNSTDLVGKSGIFTLDKDYVFASYLLRLTINSLMANPFFINYYFNWSKSQHRLKMIATRGVSQSNINANNLRQFLIHLPPLLEQQKISQILSTWDRAIEKTEQLITTRTSHKKALMQQLLTGKKRFKEFIKSKKYKNIKKFGKIPEDWRYIEVGKIASEVKCKNKSKRDLTVLSCTKYDGLVSSLEYFGGRQIFSNDTSTYKIVKRNQFAYATNHIEEGSIGYQNLYDEALISPMYTVFETQSDFVEDQFLYKVFKTDTYVQLYSSLVNGSINRRGSLRWKNFSKIKVPLPDFTEQQKIVTVLNNSDKEIELLNKKLEALKSQKKGLMQKLLKGQVRVKIGRE